MAIDLPRKWVSSITVAFEPEVFKTIDCRWILILDGHRRPVPLNLSRRIRNSIRVVAAARLNIS